MENNTLKEIGSQLLSANRILLFPHMQIDGDAYGSAVALCLALRNLGKEVYVLLEDEVPAFLSFLTCDFCLEGEPPFDSADIAIAIDCSDVGRFEKRKDWYFKGNVTICLDHHMTTGVFADFNYIDSSAAATGEIIYDLLKVMNCDFNAEIANALYAAITTDTGNFRYSNTTKRTHLIVADLYDTGLDHTKVCVEIYENVRRERVKLSADALKDMQLFCDGSAGLVSVTQKMLEVNHTSMEETEGIIDTLKSIEGIEIAALLKEKEKEIIKVSLRAKSYGNVANIAQKFHGGGHIKAAGCTIHDSLDNAKKMIIGAIEEELMKGSSI
ncbi:DHH family phosphoesterase [Anaerovorax sp. IOR16]|uniref:DHH family phosphoesterase n=1 Tax=Anaerovorax sp. IOR16 TaxID=2773458 RepID=UPI0019CFB891|nr:bifunctional oligoribonuclease/PAP phosphatase NrnA [Anaerovorax sp. IOR16]